MESRLVTDFSVLPMTDPFWGVSTSIGINHQFHHLSKNDIDQFVHTFPQTHDHKTTLLISKMHALPGDQ